MAAEDPGSSTSVPRPLPAVGALGVRVVLLACPAQPEVDPARQIEVGLLIESSPFLIFEDEIFVGIWGDLEVAAMVIPVATGKIDKQFEGTREALEGH